MKPGDLAIDKTSNSLCLITGFFNDREINRAEIFFFKGKQRRWTVATYYLEVISETR